MQALNQFCSKPQLIYCTYLKVIVTNFHGGIACTMYYGDVVLSWLAKEKEKHLESMGGSSSGFWAYYVAPYEYLLVPTYSTYVLAVPH